MARRLKFEPGPKSRAIRPLTGSFAALGNQDWKPCDGAAGALFEQHEIDHVEPAQEAVDDRPQDRLVVDVRDCGGERRAEADAVFGAFPPIVVDRSVHRLLQVSMALTHARGRARAPQTG